MSNALTTPETATLPALVARAAQALAGAVSAAEVLEARDMAGVAYDAAKRAARIGKMRQAHDELVAAAHRAQGDALLIESQAKYRLADEYDAAQERGDVQSAGGDRTSKVPDQNNAPTTAEIGISRKDIHEARLIRDAEKAAPGIIKQTVDDAVAAGEEPTRAHVRRTIFKRPITEVGARPARGRDAVNARVCDAIVTLAGLPPAAEVIRFLRGTDQAVLIDERLPQVLRWLNEFSDLWGDPDA